jgi:hypothetical protein
VSTPVALPAAPVVRNRRNWVKGAKSYASMIEAALIHYGGEAAYKQIVKYIEDSFPEEVAERKTWKNSVGGVLSSNASFASIPLAAEKKGRGGLWKLLKNTEATNETENT